MAIIQNSMAAPAQSGTSKLQDPKLAQIENAIEAKIPAEMKVEYMRVIVAGMKILFSPQTEHLMQQKFAQAGTNIVPMVADGISDLMLIIYKESGRRAHIPVMAPAALVLMCHALDWAESALHVQVTPDLIDQCSQAVTGAFFKKFNINPQAQPGVIQGAQQGA